MASDPKLPSNPGTDGTTPDPTRGVPIVPGVPFLGSAADSDTGSGPQEPAAGNDAAGGNRDATPSNTAGTAPDGVQWENFTGPVTTGAPSVLQGAGLPVPAFPPTAPNVPAASGVGTGESSPQQADIGGTTAPPDAVVSPDADVQRAPVGERSARRDKDLGPEPASALTADRLLAGTDRPPVSGWRRLLYTITFGRVNVGDSDAVRVQRALEHRISVRLGDRTRYVPVLSRKGGVGKTTVTTLLGMALADLREDRIIAMDANPDRGTLSDRSPGRADYTARQLVQNRYTIESFAQLAGYVTRDGSRLHVLASDTDPAVAQAFDDSDYRAVTDVLSRYYSIVLTDSGTGMVHSVMKGTLEKADSVVLVSGGSVDEARLASETLSWLEAHGRHDLLAKAIVVINLSSGNGTQVDVAQIEQHFRSRVDTVVRIPYDRHLAEGSRIDLTKLNPATRRAVTELAALLVDQLAS